MTLFGTPLELSLVLTALIGGYLSGSVPYGLLVGQMAGLGDIRKTGSGNIGATNMLRAGGKGLAAVTLLLDALKGTVPVLIAKQFGMDYAAITALACFTGHLFPVWLKFKGGKGVATTLGVCFGLSLPLGALVAGTWLFMAVVFKYSSLSALTAVLLAPVYCYVLIEQKWVAGLIAVIAVAVWVKHSANIKRLLNKTEPKIGKKAQA